MTSNREFTMNKCFGNQITNDEIYESGLSDLIVSSVQGINATIFMYGQTGAGKTYTMLGDYSNEISDMRRSINGK